MSSGPGFLVSELRFKVSNDRVANARLLGQPILTESSKTSSSFVSDVASF